MASWQAAFAALAKAELRLAYARVLLAEEQPEQEEQPEKVDQRSLERLAQAGLLSADVDGYRVNESFYSEVLAAEQQRPRGVERYLKLSTLERLPQQDRDRRQVLSFLCERLFETGKHYPETEINGLLRVVSNDVPGLRRALVDEGYLDRRRDGSAYWLIPEQNP